MPRGRRAADAANEPGQARLYALLWALVWAVAIFFWRGARLRGGPVTSRAHPSSDGLADSELAAHGTLRTERLVRSVADVVTITDTIPATTTAAFHTPRDC